MAVDAWAPDLASRAILTDAVHVSRDVAWRLDVKAAQNDVRDAAERGLQTRSAAHTTTTTTTTTTNNTNNYNDNNNDDYNDNHNHNHKHIIIVSYWDLTIISPTIISE